MKKSGKIVLAVVIATASIISIMAIATHVRESVEDSGLNGPENETPAQALQETLSGGEGPVKNEQGENEAAEHGK